jgi:hypothetical protein
MFAIVIYPDVSQPQTGTQAADRNVYRNMAELYRQNNAGVSGKYPAPAQLDHQEIPQ